MTTSAVGRGPARLLACLGLLMLVAAVVRWSVVEGGVATLAAVVLTVGGCLAVLVGWMWLRGVAAGQVRLQAEIALLRAERQQFAAAQDRFVDNLAHEVKTPLTIVMNQAELLLRCSSDPVAVRGYAKSIIDYVLHLAALSEAFLQLAAPLHGADVSRHQVVHLHDLILDVVRRCQSMARGREVAVVATLPESCPGGDAVELFGDPVMLGAMIENLLRNAVRGSPRGSRVELRVIEQADAARLEVRDHGAHLESVSLDSVFDWFGQTPGITPRPSGPCRGLAIAKRVVELHHGAIAVRNHPEGGCEVAITLPLWRGGSSSGADRGIPAGASSVARPA